MRPTQIERILASCFMGVKLAEIEKHHCKQSITNDCKRVFAVSCTFT